MITSVSLPAGKSLQFRYDAQGQRVIKSYFNGSTTALQWYVRDAQGNIMAIYDRSTSTEKLLQVYLYGTARLGELLLNRDSAAASLWNRHHYRIKGNRHYELNNHLGNVLAVVTDRKMAQDTTINATYTPQYFLPDVYAVQNYYAFGQNMPKWSSSALNDPARYRFGYNGKEDDDEWNKQDYGFRIYDTRLARFLSVDPLTRQYAELTPYQFASNSPISGVDMDGLEYYYAADGRYLGKSGASKELRVIADYQIFEIAKVNLSKPQNDHSWLIERSQTAYTATPENEEMLLVNWARKIQPKINDEDQRKEYSMQLFTRTFTDEKGNNFEVFMQGHTDKAYSHGVGGGAIDINGSKLFVDGKDLERWYDWKRSTIIHSHPGFGDTNFSNDWVDRRGLGGGGDIPMAIKMNVRIALVTATWNWIKLFDPQEYKKFNPEGMDAGEEAHMEASDKATNIRKYKINHTP
ncbi:MAG: RHS repeat-associated core domain-containing protein [Chitinophagales bacterium]|nr:RHS repeat-associated core domain-containing protein [Chitinophagales bacterium]